MLLYLVKGVAGKTTQTQLCRIDGSGCDQRTDCLATEEPLEIRLEGHSIAVVMRTPGDDRELAAGFLVTEGLIKNALDIRNIEQIPHCLTGTGGRPEGGFSSNIVDVRLADPKSLDLTKLTRHVFTSSSCGVCSKASIEAVRMQFPVIQEECEVDADIFLELPASLTRAQSTFRCTGGLHACALFDLEGNLLSLREDVGRHNALDKLIGEAVFQNRLPLSEKILLLSGRASFEMMQKSLAAGASVVAAISAPSSLAVQFARDANQTLVGFIRGERMNVYAGAERIRTGSRRGTFIAADAGIPSVY